MKKRIGILTSTRAEYGLLKTLYEKLLEVPEFQVGMIVTGTHLLPEYGYTFSEIEKDGVEVDEVLPVQMCSKDAKGICFSMAKTIEVFSDFFSNRNYDMLIVLGDRYETLSVCIAAMNFKIPIAHLHGGETTEGAIDEAIRHSITKMSYLHFTSMEKYRKRVIQLGENPDRVFNVGALGVENILKAPLMSKEELEKSIEFQLDKPYGVFTYHPVTLEKRNMSEEIWKVLNAIEKFPELKFIMTKANADAGGETVNKILEDFSRQHDNIFLTDSLGMVRYLSALKYCAFVIGNSSSGILEAPSFGIPTINIGDRQKGRIQADSVYNVPEDTNAIEEGIRYVVSEEVKRNAKTSKNPYGDGETSQKIVDLIIKFFSSNYSLMKTFYDLIKKNT